LHESSLHLLRALRNQRHPAFQNRLGREAVHLSQNGKYQDAQNWFHYIFNPFDNSAGPTPERFWKVQPFQYTDVRLIQDILVNLSTNQDPVLRQQTIASINNWMQNPFQPWAVAQYRPASYMLKTVMAYLDNLVAYLASLGGTR